jgi:hypothetical protein
LTEYQSRRELREAERQGLVAKPEQVFDLPTGQIKLPTPTDSIPNSVNVSEVSLVAGNGNGSVHGSGNVSGIAPVSEMLTRKRIREMERDGLLDPLTGAISQIPTPEVSPAIRSYDEVMAETEEPITASINLVTPPIVNSIRVGVDRVEDSVEQVATARSSAVAPAPVAGTDIFHNMAVDLNSRKPRVGLIIAVILVVLAGAGAAAYMLGIFK